jgi:hypothetical protein
MWIRSQDRKALLNVNQVLISPSVDGSIYYISDSLGEESNVLGIYTGEEKALRVLDEIQGKIERPYPSKVTPAFGTNCYCLSEKGQFYEMPADEDVKA